MKNESAAAFVIVVVIVGAAIGVVSWNASPRVTFTGSTTTTTETISCPTLTPTQTRGNSSIRLPDYGPLLGNLSDISVIEYEYTPAGSSSVLGDLHVLNRSFTSSGPEYLVNVTLRAVGLNITEVGSNGSTTTTAGGAQTQMASALGLVVPNGSMISVERSSGDQAVASQLTVSPLNFFEPLVGPNLSSSNSAIHPINNTVVTVGSVRMVVTNYEFPTLVLVELIEGCGSVPSISSMAGTVSHEAIQAGRVPGTDFTLVTMLSARFTFQSSSSSSPSTSENIAIVEKVTSFSI